MFDLPNPVLIEVDIHLDQFQLPPKTEQEALLPTSARNGTASPRKKTLQELAEKYKGEYSRFRKVLLKRKIPAIKEVEDMLLRPLPTRERVMGCLLYLTGARVGELIQIRKRDLEIKEKDGQKIFVIRLHTEKNKSQPLRILAFTLKSYKWCIEPIVKYSVNFDEKDRIVPYSSRYVRKIVQKFWKFHPHHWRHIRLTHMVTVHGFRGEKLRQFAGWSDDRPAKIYVHLSWEDIVV